MDVNGCVAVVTGGARGIGRAICEALAAEGAEHIAVADIDGEGAAAVADQFSGSSFACDVANEADVQRLVSETLETHGRIDLFVANAGVTVKGGVDVPDDEWRRLWDINVMGHVYAARAVLPSMLERSQGYLVHVSSAAGLLTEIGSAPYSVTKHGVVALAEWISVHHQRQGIRVSCVCPAGVATDFLDLDDPVHQFLHVSSKTAEDVAACVVEGVRNEQFLILPHEEVEEFFAYKGEDYDRWLKNFSRINEKLTRRSRSKE